MTILENREAFEPSVEDDRVPAKRVWLAGAIAAVVIVVSVLVAKGILRASTPRETDSSASPPTAGESIGIVEQTLILRARRGLDENAEQEESLRHFGWVDRTHGIARIPIDRAMDLVTDPAFMRAFGAGATPPAAAGGRGDR